MNDSTIFCVMCQEPIPAERITRLTVTCSDLCKKRRKDFLKARVEMKHCRYCHKPSTPEQRKRFQRWVRAEEKNPPPIDQLDELEKVSRAEAETRAKLPRGRPKQRRQDEEETEPEAVSTIDE